MLKSMRRELELVSALDDSLRIVARVGAASRTTEGKAISLRIQRKHILLFDAKSGERIGGTSPLDA